MSADCGPPKTKEKMLGASEATEHLLIQLLAEYQAASVLAREFGEVFWKYEQRRTRLWDRIQNEWSNQ